MKDHLALAFVGERKWLYLFHQRIRNLATIHDQHNPHLDMGSELAVAINVENLREPIIGGFGFGARTKVWGYFIRFDVAWGVEDFELNKAVPYLSLSKDI